MLLVYNTVHTMTYIGTPTVETFTGHSLISAMASAQAALTLHQHTINRINVFPVPDGDTGTNMLATLTSGLNNIDDSCPAHLGEALRTLGDGCFWGARGNSGVLLSQFIQGLSRHLADHDTCTTIDMIAALKAGYSTAYESMHQPVEGTMLSLMKLASLTFEFPVELPADLTEFWQQIVDASKYHVDDTPNQMPLLAESGVVDSGALGLFIIFVGIWAHYAGCQVDTIPLQIDGTLQPRIPAPATNNHIETEDWGFCTQFVISDGRTSARELRTLLSPFGDSILTSELGNSVKLHIHTKTPKQLIDTALSSGKPSALMIQNMDDHQSPTSILSNDTDSERTSCLISITDDGFANIFQESGLSCNIHTQQNDPSFFASLVEIIEKNFCPNIILMATSLKQFKEVQYLEASNICGRTIRTIMFHNPVQAISAALAFNPYQTIKTNIEQMASQAASTLCISINPSSSADSQVYGSQSNEDPIYISRIDGNEISSNTDPAQLIKESLPDLESHLDPIITIYGGSQSIESEANALLNTLEELIPNTTINLLFSNQSNALYLISLE